MTLTQPPVGASRPARNLSSDLKSAMLHAAKRLRRAPDVVAVPDASSDALNFTVVIGFDEAEDRYYVLDSDISGLHVETTSFEEFIEVTKDFAPDLLRERATGAKVEFKREVVFA